MIAPPPKQRTGCVIDDQVIVLDRNASRYFLIPGGAADPSNAPPPHDHQTVLLRWEDDRPARRSAARQHWITSARVDASPTRRAGLVALARLRWLEHRCAATLDRHGLDAGLRLLEQQLPSEPRPTTIARLIAAAQAGLLFWSSHDRCLPRSLALACALRAAGSGAQLVLGVALHPFAAHAWVQDGDTILNDTIDHVTLFKPILLV